MYNAYGAHLQESECYAHLPIFKLFPPIEGLPVTLPHANGPLVSEWLGNVRPWSWDCTPNTYRLPYVLFSPMRLRDCFFGAPSVGVDLPDADEEYWELADAMMAVASAPIGGTFTVVELGARYAPWALRTMVAARQLGRSRSVYALLVDPLQRHQKWIHEHFAMNGFNETQHYTLFPKFFGWSRRGSSVSLAELLQNVSSVDLLDVDVQGNEVFLLSTPADEQALATKVRRVHVEGHSKSATMRVVEMLTRLGFGIVRLAGVQSGLYSSPVGPMNFRGAYIYGANPRFDNTLNGTC